MLINRDHGSWAAVTLLLTLAAACGYVVALRGMPYGPSGGSFAGLTFGIAGTTLMAAAALLSVRKRWRTRRYGRAQAWMKFHLWGGLLSFPLILLHSGFSTGGPLTTLLLTLFCVVIASGLFGLALQQFLPRLMSERLPEETLRTQIDHVRAGLAVDAYEITAAVTGPLAEAADEQHWLERERAAGWKAIPRRAPATAPAAGSEVLRQIYLTQVRPFLQRRPGDRLPPPDFASISISGPAEFQPEVDQLRTLCEQSRRLALQLRLHGWLHNWLFLHAPLSILLLVLAAFHIYFALRY